ncbi:hypothetical protein Dsin_033232 [Dipteronia sinensis]|uniref:Uncharacterized protein n=1 Tax=Dipteronia sinensis TaxID=43782 RepID=A0AAE0DQP8_9ROSI|nr:hypothetical protein Dsin_033232 [Dipteronia sinensis]
MFAGEMAPICSGLCFEGEDYDPNGHNMDAYRMKVLHDSTTFPIDPFSTNHWSDTSKPTPAKTKTEPAQQVNEQSRPEVVKSMPPPRMPLSSVNPPNTVEHLPSAIEVGFEPYEGQEDTDFSYSLNLRTSFSARWVILRRIIPGESFCLPTLAVFCLWPPLTSTTAVSTTMLSASSSQMAHSLQNLILIAISIALTPLDTFILFLAWTVQHFKHHSYIRSRTLARLHPDFQRRTILVTGVGMTKGLALARLFYQAGHDVVGADFEPGGALVCGRVSKAIKKFYRLNPPDGKKGVEPYLRDLLDIVDREGIDLWVSCSASLAVSTRKAVSSSAAAN